MTNNQTHVSISEEEEFTVLIEWPGQRGGIQQASSGGDVLQAMQEKSEKAINLAMGTVRAMAYQVSKTMNTLEDKVRPDQAEVGFGINLDTEVGALLAKASTGAQITVKLKWAIDQPERAKILVSE